MEPTEIVIAYEDRLRLSELAGQLTDAQWVADNMWVANALLIIAMMCVMVALTIILAYPVVDDIGWYWLDNEREKRAKLRRKLWLILACMFAMTVGFEVLAVSIAHEFQLHDVEVIQAQMDEIYRMWGY